MSDATAGLTTDNAPPQQAGNIQPATAPVGVEQTAPTDDLLAEPAPERAVFDRGYVESIRREAQRYRGEAQTAAAQAQRYDAVFGQYEEADQQVWFDLARTWAENPEKAAQVMQQIAAGVLGDGRTSSMDNVVEQKNQERLDDQIGELTREELTPDRVKEIVEQSFQSREQRAQEQAAIDNVMTEVRSLGFDPDSAEGFMVLWNANHQTNGDIKAAAEMVKTYRQGVIDEYVQGRSSGRVAMPTAGGVQATGTPAPITNFDDARRAADAYLQERRGA